MGKGRQQLNLLPVSYFKNADCEFDWWVLECSDRHRHSRGIGINCTYTIGGNPLDPAGNFSVILNLNN
ncbi:hypothetical protein BV900_17105 [Agrobacterium tumefaciens]|nr:hypothetical protein BV900_17105 [Agrobacterium tumefaciens]